MRKDRFESRIRELLPEASDAALKKWVEYAQELDRDGTEHETDFYDSTYVELSLIKRRQGLQTATELFNYGEHFTFNPFELRGAASLLTEGWPLEKIQAYAVENGCDPTEAEYEESAKALLSFQSGEWDIRENKQRFSTDLAYAARQLYTLEKELEGQEGVFAEWLRSAYESDDDFERPLAEDVNELCRAFRDVKRQYGHDIAQQLYNTQAVILPAEIRNAAQYLSLGGSIDHVPALAEVGFLMDTSDDDAVLRAIEHMNAGEDADKIYCAVQDKAQVSNTGPNSPQWQQTM